MAICRFGDASDVYVYYSSAGGIECCGCCLSKRDTVNLANEAAMIAHLQAHVAAGHHVPDDAFERLRAGEP